MSDNALIVIVCFTIACIAIDLLRRRYGYHRSSHAPEWEQNVAEWQDIVLKAIRIQAPDSTIRNLIACRDHAIVELRRHDRRSADRALLAAVAETNKALELSVAANNS
jgi:hypothetical protein